MAVDNGADFLWRVLGGDYLWAARIPALLLTATFQKIMLKQTLYA